MNRQYRPLTLGELICAVAGYSNNDHEIGLTVADLLHRRVVVRARPSAITTILRSVGSIHKH